MTLSEAARKIGLKDPSTLRHAVQRGILETELIGDHFHVVTQAQLDAYVAHVQANKGGRGKKRGPRRRPPEPPTESTE